MPLENGKYTIVNKEFGKVVGVSANGPVAPVAAVSEDVNKAPVVRRLNVHCLPHSSSVSVTVLR